MNPGFDKTKIQKLIQRYRGRRLHRGGKFAPETMTDLYLQIGQMSETSGGVIVTRRGGKDNFPSVIEGPSIQPNRMYNNKCKRMDKIITQLIFILHPILKLTCLFAKIDVP